MKSEKFAIYLSFVSVIVFLMSAVICYIKINGRIDEIENKISVAAFTFANSSSEMDIKSSDMFEVSNNAIAENKVTLSALYTNPLHDKYKFKIIMDNYTSYIKSSGVDGIKSKEYTYEILKDDKVVLKETEIPSYEKDSQIELITESIKSSNNKVIYEIIFRFYANEYDQSHLLGTRLDSNLKVEAIN